MTWWTILSMLQTQAPTEIKVVAEMLRDLGPWGFCAVLMYVVRFLYVGREADRAKADAEKQALNDRLISAVEEGNTVMNAATRNQERILDAVLHRGQSSTPGGRP